MDFIDQLKQFSSRIEGMKNNIHTEEATKTSIVMPFFAMLGYDVFNPTEFIPEFTADVGIKKGEKVDYAIVMDGSPVILIECKSISENLQKHDSQLFRYFATSNAKFAILTNGIIYRFYTDLEETNKMDSTPFLEINMLNLKENQVPELKKFCKAEFNVDRIFNTASVLKYSNEFKSMFSALLATPSDEFVRLFLQNVYTGVKTQAVVDKFRPILKKALSDYISETMNEKIKAALDSNSNDDDTVTDIPAETPASAPASASEKSPKQKSNSKIVTTEEELQAFHIVKNMLKDVVDENDICYKDTESYFGILYQNNIRKWICRFRLTPNAKSLCIPDENKKEVRISLSSVYDAIEYRDKILDVVKRFL